MHQIQVSPELSVSNKQEFQHWESNKKFLMALISWSVGLGCSWRFTENAIAMGGAPFVLTYIIILVIIGIPCTYIELGIGQFNGEGASCTWYLCPFLKGIGYASVFVLTCVVMYYNVIVSYLLHYAYASTSFILPWSVCDPKWASINCYTYALNASHRLFCQKRFNTRFCEDLRWENSAMHYYGSVVNTRSTGAYGPSSWETMLSSAISCLFIFLMNCKGTKSMQKVMEIVTYYPYIALAVLLFASFSDPGCKQGLHLVHIRELHKLRHINIWGTTLTQLVYSVGIGLSGLITLGSQRPFRNPLHFQACSLNICNLLTSFLHAVMIFNCLGILSRGINTPIDSVANSTDSLLFSKIPLAFLYFPWDIPHVWSILFYTSYYITGLRAQAIMVFALLSCLYSWKPKMLDYSMFYSAVVIIVLMVLGYPMYMWKWNSVTTYIHNVALGPLILTVCFLQFLGVVWFYGVTRFIDDMHFMLGFRASVFWQIAWSLSPVIIGTLFAVSLYYIFTLPSVGILLTIGKWIAISTPLFLVLIGMLTHILKMRKRFKWSELFKSSEKWGPSDPTLRKSREMFSSHSMTKEYMYRQNRVREKLQIMEDEENE